MTHPRDTPYNLYSPAPFGRLERVPRDRWPDVLSTIDPQQRWGLAHAIEDPALRRAAIDVVIELDMADLRKRQAWVKHRRRALRTDGAIEAPDLHHRVDPGGRGVQVNIRLRPPVFDDLYEAAEGVGLSHTALARMLVVNGVARIMAERPREEWA